MEKLYRKGAIGALTDEYEKALNELKNLLLQIPDNKFEKIYNEKTDIEFQSIRNIVLHIINSGYGYANHIRKRFGNSYVVPKIEIVKTEHGILKLDEMFEYTVETFEDKWQLTYKELMNTIIKTSWTTYDLEAITEHAIVHILRHRLQIEKMIVKHGIL
ncbi:DinB family protein [Oceanihabitans sp. 2_MG-2023]|uniref:DinB family protein n=1 Tax=Oceanihabitans sp. 2_MG-2023 TaxID=3062661 RepID=UPI0026E48DE5|nr:DinB family protein [Oceanihabitans sp. 2_MG-2023]MDO6596882.1 DinB family protein [Oceanihabitans sp. 2_MG-2023]